MDKYSVLKEYFGYDDFKYPQDIVIDEVMANKDVIAILPTGFGKSIIFQVLALLQEGMTIIISPLIALMEDQVQKLKKKNISAEVLNSSLNEIEQKRIYQKCIKSQIKMLYVSPERLENRTFLSFILTLKVSMIVIDEAHTILWAEGFRYAFGEISQFIQKLSSRPKLLALTATATSQTIHKIANYLSMNQPSIIDLPMDRTNLFYGVVFPKHKEEYLKKYILKHFKEKGIIYCLTRKQVELLYQRLTSLKFSCTYYHGGLDQELRKANQEAFTKGNYDVMICTNAFGMGIDIPNIRYVIEYSLPQSIEDLAQQVGRASRDGAYGEGIVLFSFEDIQTIEYFIAQQKDRIIQKQYQQKLDSIVDYCLSKKCRHQFISQYFHNKEEICKINCDNCQKKMDNR